MHVYCKNTVSQRIPCFFFLFLFNPHPFPMLAKIGKTSTCHTETNGRKREREEKFGFEAYFKGSKKSWSSLFFLFYCFWFLLVNFDHTSLHDTYFCTLYGAWSNTIVCILYCILLSYYIILFCTSFFLLT